jgi:Family of unknown function (DUF6188)
LSHGGAREQYLFVGQPSRQDVPRSAMHFDADGPWELDVKGFEVLHLGIGAFLVDIFAYGDSGITSQIRLEQEFELHAVDGTRKMLDPRDWTPLAALFVLRNDTIRVLRISKTSDLRVEFASGRVITCVPDGGRYDVWEVHAPGGVLVVGRTGEPVIWDGEPDLPSRGRSEH